MFMILLTFIVLFTIINKDFKRGRAWHPAVIALGVPFLFVLAVSGANFMTLALGLLLVSLIAKATRPRRRVRVHAVPSVPKSPPALKPSTAPDLRHKVEPTLEFGESARDFGRHLDVFLQEVRTATRDGTVRVERGTSPGTSRLKTDAPLAAAPRSVDSLLREHQRTLPPEAVRKIHAIGERVEETQRYLQERGRGDGEHAFLLRQTVEDYLPGVVRAYARLPRSIVNSAPIDENGRTGKDLLVEQLDLLEKGVTDILTAAAKAEGQDLLAQGRFLKDRFQRADDDFDI